MALPRLLTIMGSGETAPTMVKVHRSIKELLGPEASGVLLDTPYGFQRNADDLSARAVAYFRDSVGMKMTPADFRTSEDLEGDKGAVLTARMAETPLLFSGPGSPTYALRQWAGTLVPGLLAEKLALGGAVTFAQRSGSHARSSHYPCLRDLQGRRGPPVGRRVGPHVRARHPGGRDPALRQRRRRNPRHEVLLSRGGAARVSGDARSPMATSCSVSTSTRR